MTAPRRIQLSRTAGWRMPENTVKVDRSTRWGNPFTVGDRVQSSPDMPVAVCFSAKQAVEAYRSFLNHRIGQAFRAAVTDDLSGKNLACWCRLCARHAGGKPLDEVCPDCAPCHADVLGALANGFSCEAVP